MSEPIVIEIYSDYLCPWCYIASIRFDGIKEEYRDQVSLRWLSYPLRREEQPGRRPNPRTASHISRPQQEETSVIFKPWPLDKDLPSSSLSALEAAKCAELQGEELARRFHLRLMKANFEESQDISQREVLLALAAEVGLEVKSFQRHLVSGQMRPKVLQEFERARSLNIFGIPTAVFGGKIRLEGAVPVDMYRRAIAVCGKD